MSLIYLWNNIKPAKLQTSYFAAAFLILFLSMINFYIYCCYINSSPIQSYHRLDWLFWINLMTFSGICLLLVFLSFFLFVPMFRKVLSDTDQIKETNGKLSDAEESLKESEQCKELFFATLAHDLTIPINAEYRVLNMLQSGHFGELTESQKQIVKEVIKSNRFKDHVVDNLLATYRYQAGLAETKKTPTDLNAIIQRLLTYDLSLLLQEKQHDILLELSPELPPFPSNPVEIERVLKNLIQNAIYYTPEHGQIKVITGYSNDTFVFITIKDNGPGIPVEKQKYLFSPFNSQLRPFKQIGSGLGLYLSKQIIEYHGGKLTLASEAGSGCEVSFVIPVSSVL